MERPAPRERLRRDGPPAVPRRSASLILARDGADGLELLLVRRNPAQRFAGGCWVFPGGALDAGETHRMAAVRELAEEAGVGGVEHEALVEYTRWITPDLVAIRFDTRFFVARAPEGARARPDGEEAVDLRWLAPRAALDAYVAGELQLMFPTLKLLEGLTAFASVAQLLDHARELEISPILPRVVVDGDAPRIVLPGEPGYAA